VIGLSRLKLPPKAAAVNTKWVTSDSEETERRGCGSEAFHTQPIRYKINDLFS
jgi:hypothetical protein